MNGNSNFEVKKEDINKALDQLQGTGAFTKEQIEAARKKMQNMDQNQYNAIIQKGLQQAQDPEFQKKVQEAMKKQNQTN